MTGLLSYDDALDRLLSLASPMPMREIPIIDAIGRYLAEPLTAQRTQPAADLSAMDGYAVADPEREEWNIVGELSAGHPFAGILQGLDAVRISTGAVMPSGTASVFVQEITRRNGSKLSLQNQRPTPLDKHIRRTGSDFSTGDVLCKRGAPITPRLMALALTAGVWRVRVPRLPNIAILQIGDELYDPCEDGASTGAHQLPAVNGPMVSAMLQGLGMTPTLHPILPDQPQAMVDAMQLNRDADIVVTIGGASVGDHDHIAEALQKIGAETAFWKVAIKPGKPLLVARRDTQIILGLPGNPASAFVTACLFLQPLVKHLMGAATPKPQAVALPVAEELAENGDRRTFLRAKFRNGELTAHTEQSSGLLHALSQADYLIDRAPHAEKAAAGSVVDAYRLTNHGIA